MIPLGDKFSTFLDEVDGEVCIVKSQDFSIAGRETVTCFREYLGYRLGTRLGLAVPRTRLLVHPRYGRISAQYFIRGSRTVDEIRWHELTTSGTGFRILLLDLLCDNHDRRLDNLIEAHGTVFPIDFNVAFAFAHKGRAEARMSRIVMSWFGVEGAISLRPEDWELLSGEIARFEKLLESRYLNYAVSEIEEHFLPLEERVQLLESLEERATLIRPHLERWWETTIAPLHRLAYV